MKNTLLLFFLLVSLFGCQHDDKEQLKDERKALYPTPFELFRDSYKQNTMFKYGFSDSLYFRDSPIAQVTQVHLFPHKKGYSKMWVTSLDRVEAFLTEGKLYIKLFERHGVAETGTVIIIEGNEFKTVASYRDAPGMTTPDMNPDQYLPAPHTLFKVPYIHDYMMNAQSLLLNKESYEVGDTIYGAMFYEGKWDMHGFIDASGNPDVRNIFIKGGFKAVVREEGYLP